MSLTKKQISLVDELQNGGYIWKAGSTFYLARVNGALATGHPRFQSEVIAAKTVNALMPLLAQEEGRDRWRLKGDKP